MRNERGISLVALIVTIFVIAILAATVIYTALYDNLDVATNAQIFNDMSELRDAVSQRALENKIDSATYPVVGTPLSDDSPEEVGDVVYGSGWYLISDEQHKNELNMNNLKGEYLVNYSTNEVVSKRVIDYKGEEYHNLRDLSNAMVAGDSQNIAVEYDKVKGVNRPVLTKGMLPVKYVGGSYIVCTEDDDSWYNYSGDDQVWATVMLMDEIEIQKDGTRYTAEEIKDMDIKKLRGAVVISEGSSFVWIPRYTFKEVDGEISIVYSCLLGDYLRDGYTKHPAFYSGEYTGATASGETNRNTGYDYGGEELTGIWVSKHDAGIEY